MNEIQQLAEITYKKIFADLGGKLPYFQRTPEGIEKLVLDNINLVNEKIKKKIFIEALADLIKTNEIKEIKEQERKYGQALLANNELIVELYKWLIDISEDINSYEKYFGIIHSSRNSFIWINHHDKIEIFYKKLTNKYIDKNTTLEDFQKIFLNTPIEEISNKNTWILRSQNKQPNKKAINDMIILLVKHRMIEEIEVAPKNEYLEIVNGCFNTPEGELKMTAANFTKNGRKLNSTHYLELDNIISSL